jgi:hypothetical protein
VDQQRHGQRPCAGESASKTGKAPHESRPVASAHCVYTIQLHSIFRTNGQFGEEARRSAVLPQ